MMMMVIVVSAAEDGLVYIWAKRGLNNFRRTRGFGFVVLIIREKWLSPRVCNVSINRSIRNFLILGQCALEDHRRVAVSLSCNDSGAEMTIYTYHAIIHFRKYAPYSCTEIRH